MVARGRKRHDSLRRRPPWTENDEYAILPFMEDIVANEEKVAVPVVAKKTAKEMPNWLWIILCVLGLGTPIPCAAFWWDMVKVGHPGDSMLTNIMLWILGISATSAAILAWIQEYRIRKIKQRTSPSAQDIEKAKGEAREEERNRIDGERSREAERQSAADSTDIQQVMRITVGTPPPLLYEGEDESQLTLQLAAERHVDVRLDAMGFQISSAVVGGIQIGSIAADDQPYVPYFQFVQPSSEVARGSPAPILGQINLRVRSSTWARIERETRGQRLVESHISGIVGVLVDNRSWHAFKFELQPAVGLRGLPKPSTTARPRCRGRRSEGPCSRTVRGGRRSG